MRRSSHTKATIILSITAMAGVLAACGEDPVPTPDPGTTPPGEESPVEESPSEESSTTEEQASGNYPEDLRIQIVSDSGSVPPPNDSREAVVVEEGTLTYYASTRYEDELGSEAFVTETIEIDDAAVAEIMAAYEVADAALQDPTEQGVGGAYVIWMIDGTGYNVAETGTNDEAIALAQTAFSYVPDDVRAEGRAAIEEYNNSGNH